MKLPSTLFLLFLSVSIASFHLLPAEQTNIELKESVREQRRIGQTRTQDRQSRSVSTLKVLNFSADGDQQPDSDNEYTAQRKKQAKRNKAEKKNQAKSKNKKGKSNKRKGLKAKRGGKGQKGKRNNRKNGNKNRILFNCC